MQAKRGHAAKARLTQVLGLMAVAMVMVAVGGGGVDHCFFVLGRLVVPVADEGGQLDAVVQAVRVGAH